MELQAGDFVKVPLGSREIAGIVWDDDADHEKLEARRLKTVLQKFDCPPLSADMREFVGWVARYTVSPLGMVSQMVLRVPAALAPAVPVEGLRFSGIMPTRLTGARKAVMDFADAGLFWTRSGLANAAGVSSSVVKGLFDLGVLERVEIAPEAAVEIPDPDHVQPDLQEQQAVVASTLVSAVENGCFTVHLVDGVTGSGKTEVYFEAIAEALRQNRQVLILLPEIALTSVFLERFEMRFGVRPAQWHSDITPKMREMVWRQVTTGEVRVVAGARSALFLPFPDPGLIVVDEEHDPAYKQEERVHYNARDMAVVRGSIGGFPVVLASATPSVESRVNANGGRYSYHRMEQRYADAVLPELAAIDMRKNPPPPGKFISPLLVKAIGETIERGEQSLLFLNRRGYAPLTLCRVCGHRIQCPNCSTWLVEHRFRQQLQCHHCGYFEKTPDSCPQCGTMDHMVACGPGVERLGEEVLDLFPDARIILMSSDMGGGVRRLRLELEAIANGEADIVVGTQLVAKGHNFPLMTCVGVVDADLGLQHGDLRAAERTFQLLSQVTGRAGRAGGHSRGFLQSYQPDHPVIQSIVSGEREAFYEREITQRQSAGLPPFGRLAGIVVSARERLVAQEHARLLGQAAPASPGISVLGPSEAPLALIRGRYRFRLLVHADRRSDLQGYLRQWLDNGPSERGSIRVSVDIDPQSFV